MSLVEVVATLLEHYLQLEVQAAASQGLIQLVVQSIVSQFQAEVQDMLLEITSVLYVLVVVLDRVLMQQ